MSREPLDFSDLTAIEEPVPIGKDNFILKEASGDVAIKHRNAIIACSKMTDGKITGIKGLPETETKLVSMCLFWNCPENEKLHNKEVSEAIIRSWPQRVQKALYKRIKDISEMDDDESLESLIKQRDELNKKIDQLQEDKLKNEQSDTTAGLG